MKKVLIATNSLDIGGAETNIIEGAIGLKALGRYEPIIVSNGGKFVSLLKKYNIKHYDVHLNNKNPFYYFSTYNKLNKIMKKEKIDLIHVHARIPAFFGNIMANKYNKPMVSSVHYSFKVNWLYKKITKWGDKIITVSDDLSRYVLNNYQVKNRDISIIKNGIDTDKFKNDIDNNDIILKHNINPCGNRIVHISRLDKSTVKTLDILLDIFIKLDKKITNLELIIVGNGSEYDRLISKGNNINNQLRRDAIKFIGSVYGEVNKYTSLATLFIGVSRSALEAMSASKNVILSGDQGYLGLFTKDKLKKAMDTNFCCRSENSVNDKTLYNDIIRYFNNTNDEDKIRMEKYNRDVVLKYYSNKRMVEEVSKVYDDIINSR